MVLYPILLSQSWSTTVPIFMLVSGIAQLGQNLALSRLATLDSPQGGGGGGGTLIFSHIRRLGPFFGFKILNFNIFGGFQKNKYFLEYEDFVDNFLGSSQNWASLRVISMQFRVFF